MNTKAPNTPNVETTEHNPIEGLDETDTRSVLCVMGQNGDTRIMWTRTVEAEVDEAKAAFKRYKDRGFKAYKVDKAGHKVGEPIDEFDVNAEMIIFVPPMAGG